MAAWSWRRRRALLTSRCSPARATFDRASALEPREVEPVTLWRAGQLARLAFQSTAWKRDRMLRAVKLGRRRSAARAEHLEVVAPPGPGRQVLSGVGIWPWVELASRHGMPLGELAHLAGVAMSELRDPDRRFDQNVANRLADIVCRHCGPDAGVAAALTAEAGQFALIEVLARTAPTLGQGLEQVSRFFSLIHSESGLEYVRLPKGGGVLRLRLPTDYEVHFGLVDLMFSVCLVTMRRETDPSLVPLEMWLRRRAPANTSLYESFFGNVRFEMDDDRMILSRETVELTTKRPNAEVHAAAVDGAKKLVP